AWAAAGHVRLTDGDVCDYAVVEEDIGALSKRFKIRDIGFDPYNAENLTQNLESKFGIPRFAFAQTTQNFAGPTGEFERLVIAGKMHHAGHPTLNWQIGHACCKTDANNNRRIQKPRRGDPKTVDGVVAGIMALGRQMDTEAESQISVYERE